MQDCVFCNIIARTIDSEILLENDDVIVIRDILPKAPIHLLVIPKKHILSINHLGEDEVALGGKMLAAAKTMAEKMGFADKGYKLQFNVGKDGGQVIPHLHLHILAGKKFGE